MKRVYRSRALDPGMYSGLNIVVARSPQMGLGHVPAQTRYPRPLGQIERYFLNCHYLNIIDKVGHVSGQITASANGVHLRTRSWPILTLARPIPIFNLHFPLPLSQFLFFNEYSTFSFFGGCVKIGTYHLVVVFRLGLLC